MLVLWGVLAGLLFCLETIYHIYGFGLQIWEPWYMLTLIVSLSAIETMAIGLLRGKKKKVVLYVCVWLAIVWNGLQLGYLHIFKQPLLFEAIFRSGRDALTNYWREALTGAAEVSPFLLIMIALGVAIVFCVEKRYLQIPDFDSLQVLRLVVILTAGISGSVSIMEVGKAVEADYYEDYHEFYDPLTIAERMGVLPMLKRDTTGSIASIAESLVSALPFRKHNSQPASSGLSANTTVQSDTWKQFDAQGGQINAEDSVSDGDAQEEAGEPEVFVPVQNSLPIDFQVLQASSNNKKTTWLEEYIEGQSPTMTNEYTGIFAGYNLIYLTAEGFSPYAVREDLTPTLYRLVNTGFVFNNYYVPLWQTSTSDGEYVNCTGMIPDGQYSFRKSASNDMAFSLPVYFAKEGVRSMAYHNNSLTYYDRNLSHPNLGYFFKASKLGSLPADTWGDHIFYMEHPNQWPASDLEMMQGTLPEYIEEERFHAYYMTVSGHMNYNFSGNAMSSKNREAVRDLELSENARAYIACQIELDKALAYLLDELEKAGKLEKTVICLSADHYPYAMSEDQYEELAGRDLTAGKEMFRNNLILWNAGIEEPVMVDKACCAMDIMPTLLNLFGFAYDSRMYAGRDIFSTEPGLVIFNDRSFVTDLCTYDRKKKVTTWTEAGDMLSEEEKTAYLESVQQEVKDRYQFSAYVLEEDYYSNVRAAIPGW